MTQSIGYFEFHTFTCNWVFLQNGMASFTQVKGLNTSSSATYNGLPNSTTTFFNCASK